jgi:hypothetical protein
MSNGGGTATKSNFKAATDAANKAPSQPGVVHCPNPRPEITVSWRQHDFGRVKKGSTPPVHDLVIRSTGGKNLTSIAVRASGRHFAIDDPGGFATTLAPGESTTVRIKFEPKSYGPKTGKIRINSDAANEKSISIDVTGKQFSVISFLVEEEAKDAEKPVPVENVTFKLKQGEEPEQEVTTGPDGKVEVETEVDGDFALESVAHDLLLEFRSLGTK